VADTPLAQELADGAEEVVLQVEQAVEALQDGLGGRGWTTAAQGSRQAVQGRGAGGEQGGARRWWPP
jgi:hypothetical protein